MEQAVTLSPEDVKLVKSVCDDRLLKAVRAVFFGLANTEDKELVRGAFKNARLKTIFTQRFLPKLDRDTPIGMVQDVWLGAENMVFDKPESTIRQAIGYKQQSIQMTAQALALLDDPDKETPITEYDPSRIIDEWGIALLSRNMFVRHVESQLGYFKLIADQKDETPAETKKRITSDSSK